MTAHVVFTAIDPVAPATTSATMVREVIREFIGFKGLLMSDDISMGALSGTLAERTRAAIAAGCDVVLHCNGALDEMRAVADAAPLLAGEAQRAPRRRLRGEERAPAPFDVRPPSSAESRSADGPRLGSRRRRHRMIAEDRSSTTDHCPSAPPTSRR